MRVSANCSRYLKVGTISVYSALQRRFDGFAFYSRAPAIRSYDSALCTFGGLATYMRYVSSEFEPRAASETPMLIPVTVPGRNCATAIYLLLYSLIKLRTFRCRSDHMFHSRQIGDSAGCEQKRAPLFSSYAGDSAALSQSSTVRSLADIC